MIDADYYGKGVCHWELTGVGMSLKASGKYEETDFAPSLEKEQILQSASKKTYFWKGGYPKVASMISRIQGSHQPRITPSQTEQICLL